MQFNKKKFLEDLDSILRSGYGCTDKNANVKQLYVQQIHQHLR